MGREALLEEAGLWLSFEVFADGCSGRGCISDWGNSLGRCLEVRKHQHVWRPGSSWAGRGSRLEADVKGSICPGRSREPWRCLIKMLPQRLLIQGKVGRRNLRSALRNSEEATGDGGGICQGAALPCHPWPNLPPTQSQS